MDKTVRYGTVCYGMARRGLRAVNQHVDNINKIVKLAEKRVKTKTHEKTESNEVRPLADTLLAGKGIVSVASGKSDLKIRQARVANGLQSSIW